MSHKSGKPGKSGRIKPENHASQPEQVFGQALALHQQGQLEQAGQLYEEVLKIQPEHSDALHLMGVLHHQAGNNEMALDLINRAIRLDPANPVFHDNLGTVYQAAGRLIDALECCQKAVALAPDYAGAHFNLGNIFTGQGRVNEAVACYQNALALKPNYADACIRLGNALKSLEHFEEAAACYNRALALDPNYAEAHFNLGNVFDSQGKPDEAAACYRKALALKPDYADAHFNLGNVLAGQGRMEEAVACYKNALALKPDHAEGHYSLGNAQFYLRRMDDAVTSFNHAISLKPEYAEAFYRRGAVLYDMGLQEEALADCNRALALKPDYAEARWAMTLFLIPVICSTEKERQRARQRFLEDLEELDKWFDASRMDRGVDAVGNQQPFFLAYHEEDNRPLLSRYGALCDRLMAYWQAHQGVTRNHPDAPTGRIKIGIVSQHIRSHSVWDALIKGWVLHLDRSRFELQVFYLGASSDTETELARSAATVFVRDCSSFQEWAETILSHKPAVLIYPEIGMHQMTAKLACLRLAPVQIASWGHPETTGLPAMDYYLSAEGLEPENAELHYTEQLVKLPSLGCCYQRSGVAAAAPDLAQLGIRPGEPLLLCPGTPFKYAPQHDRVLVEIARLLGRCQFVFFAPPREKDWANRLKERLELAFDKAGLAFNDFVVFLPWQEKPAFYGLMQSACVFLDSIGFSGFNTTVQAMECNLPVVTREGRFMRGRLASGILRRMGLQELVAATGEEYILLAVKLAQDKTYRAAISERIKASRHVLFDDQEPVRALERFLLGKLGAPSE